MPDPSPSPFSAPLLRRAAPHGARCGAWAFASLLALAGMGALAVLGGQHAGLQDPSVTMPWQFLLPTRARQVAPAAGGAWQPVQQPARVWQPTPAMPQPVAPLLTQPAGAGWQSEPVAGARQVAQPALGAGGNVNTVYAAGAWEGPAVGDLNEAAKVQRLKHLEEQAIEAMTQAVNSGKKVVFPNALIAGDCVINYLLFKANLLSKVEVLAVDTLHLFPETMPFLAEMEKAYNFKAYKTMAVGVTGEGAEAKANYDKMYGADLWQTNIEEYDRVCKVEPFQRGLKDLGAEIIITGRTRWQGNERAWLDIYEAPRKAGGFGNCNPIAYWTLEDTFDYIAMNKLLAHPLHAKGYPSLGDAKDTVPIPNDGSVYFKDFKFTGDKTEWLGYALERKGRFVGLKNKDGSVKTECGIHVDGAEKTFDRDLWDTSTTVQNVETEDELTKLKNLPQSSMVVIYAPWCQYCQAMEGSFEELSKSQGLESFNFFKFRGDTVRDFVQTNFDTQSFPTIGFMKDGNFQKYDSEDRSVPAFRRFIKSMDTSIAMNE